MLEFKVTTERRLYDNGLKLTQIEKDIVAHNLGPSHESMLTLIGSMKNGESRQGETNVRQGETNDRQGETNVRQGETNVRQGETNVRQEETNVRQNDATNALEKKSILIEYKLSLMDTAKISAMSAVISIPMLEIVKLILAAITHQP